MLQDEFHQPFNVVNRTGGGGVVGHAAIAQAPADGYTIGVITIEIGTFKWLGQRSEEHTSELQSLMRISYAVFCLKKKSIVRNTSRHSTSNTTRISYYRQTSYRYTTNLTTSTSQQ